MKYSDEDKRYLREWWQNFKWAAIGLALGFVAGHLFMFIAERSHG